MAYSKSMLLTGAGFTANFGTPVASQVHNLICNHAQVLADPSLKAYAETEPDYEQLYNAVVNGPYSAQQKDAIQSAVSDAYAQIDSVLRRLHSPTGTGLSVLRAQELIGCFRGQNGQTGAYFTLNQDLYLERHQYNRARPVLPGIHVPIEWFQAYSADADERGFQTALPSAREVSALPNVDALAAEVAYVKLHGSCNWKSAVRPQQMVIGTDKTGQIAAEPLLAWYFEQFRNALHGGDVRLLCIGYGFRDDHVNDVIADAIDNAGLHLYVMNPKPRAEFTAHVGGVNRGQTIVRGLQGYFNHGLLAICPHNTGYRTAEWEYLCDHYFGGRFKEVMGAG
jgi:hypothetical protein